MCVKSTSHRLLEQYSWKDVIKADRESMVSFEKYLSHFSLHTCNNVIDAIMFYPDSLHKTLHSYPM